MPTGYLLIFSWTLVALGGALFLGTGAALVTYRRTGSMPGSPQDAGPQPPPEGWTRRIAVRCTAGLVVAAVGVAGLVSTSG